MERRVLWPWLCLLIIKNATASAVWDFGTDVKGSSVVTHKSGEITIRDKNTFITLPVPPCFELKYVHVEVNNQLTTPTVTYNNDTHTVQISYKQLQLGVSTYDIVGKGKRSRQCDGRRGIRKGREQGGGGGHNRPNKYCPHSNYPPPWFPKKYEKNGAHKKYPNQQKPPHNRANGQNPLMLSEWPPFGYYDEHIWW